MGVTPEAVEASKALLMPKRLVDRAADGRSKSIEMSEDVTAWARTTTTTHATSNSTRCGDQNAVWCILSFSIQSPGLDQVLPQLCPYNSTSPYSRVRGSLWLLKFQIIDLLPNLWNATSVVDPREHTTWVLMELSLGRGREFQLGGSSVSVFQGYSPLYSNCFF